MANASFAPMFLYDSPLLGPADIQTTLNQTLFTYICPQHVKGFDFCDNERGVTFNPVMLQRHTSGN